jgi:signal peptidase I
VDEDQNRPNPEELPAAASVTGEAGIAPVAVAEDSPAEAPAADAVPPPVEEDEHPPRNAIAEWAVTILLLLFGTTMLVQAYVIPTGSMKDTLLIGDHLLVDKLAYAPPGGISKYLLPYRQVKRGDIIVFRYPLDIHNTFVKRAIGIPGDRIKIVDKTVFVNGKPMNEPYKVHRPGYSDDYKHFFPGNSYPYLRKEAQEMLERHVDRKTGELVVPDDCYFAMGDNRDESDDSRFWGFVPRGNIIGKPLIVYWSFDAPTEHLQDPSISLDHVKNVVVHFFDRTRWRRTFMIVRGHPLE